MAEKKAEKEKVKLGKVYNPYGFPVRIINDLGKEQWVMQNDRVKIRLGKDGKYDQSLLVLPAYDIKRKKNQQRIKGLGDIPINRTTIPNLRKLAWAIGLDVSDSLIKRSLIEVINGKINEWQLPVENKSGLESLRK